MLSEAKTQRRPHSARERESERESVWVFLCCFVVFVYFFEQGKKRHVEETVVVKRGKKGEARRWFKRAAA